MNALLGNNNADSNGQGSSPLGKIAGQFMGSSNQGHGGAPGGGSGGLGKIGGALASSFLKPGDKPEQPQNFHGGAPSGHQQQHGLAGSLMGGVANMFGGNKPSHGVSALISWI